MPVIKRHGPAYKAADDMSCRMRDCGVPSFYWGFRDKHVPRPFTFTAEREWAKEGEQLTRSADSQQETIDKIFQTDLLKGDPMMIGVGSYPTNEFGIVFGAAVIRRALELSMRPQMISIYDFPREIEFDKLKYPDLVVLIHFYADCSVGRLDVGREWLSHFDDTFMIAIVGGDNPVNFFDYKVHFPLDEALYFKGGGASVG